MKAALQDAAARFDRMSTRERALICVAVLAGVLIAWDAAMMRPLDRRRAAYQAEIAAIQASIAAASMTTEEAVASNPALKAFAKQKSVQAALDSINGKLSAASVGLIAPQRMVEALHDVLSRQQGLRLVSLHNKPVIGITQPGDGASVEAGPYVHPVELVVEGRYLDVLAYLRALESLPWHFNWKSLELNTIESPLNRVRIELTTLSMEREWLGV